MKKGVLLIHLLFFGIASLIAQNPYADIGKTTEVLTLSNGKYQEIIPNDTLVRIGSVLFNTQTEEVAAFLPDDSTNTGEVVEADASSRFLSVDPIAREFPELTPYQFASNTPIQAIDLDGEESRYYKISFDEKTHKSHLTLASEQPRWIGLSINFIYKGNTYYYGDMPGRILSMISNVTEESTKQIVSEKDEEYLDNYFSSRKTVQEERKAFKEKQANDIREIFEAAAYAKVLSSKKKTSVLAQTTTRNNRVAAKADDVTHFNPKKIRFSQSSVNDAAEIIESMAKKGWVGSPINVVVMKDGTMTTMDNTRVFAAQQTGTTIQARVRQHSDLLSPSEINSFTTKKGVPKTWGEAIELRIGKQNAEFRSSNPQGSWTQPASN